MSEKKAEAAEGKAKGGSKMPVIAVAALVLAGGGFFMMKGKGDKPKVKKIELGAAVTLKEILVNLKGGDTYLKTEIALQAVKEFQAKEIEENAALINDAIILRLKSKTPQDLDSVDKLKDLKREIEEDVNSILPKKEGEHKEGEEGGDAEKKDGEESKDAKDSKDSKDSEDKGHEKATDKKKPAKPSKYDSETGPIMKVYFNSFATQ